MCDRTSHVSEATGAGVGENGGPLSIDTTNLCFPDDSSAATCRCGLPKPSQADQRTIVRPMALDAIGAAIV